MSKANNKIPELRFPEFQSEWKAQPVSSLIVRCSKALEPQPHNEYQEIGVRSHGKGIFHKDPVLGKTLGNKRVFHVVPNALVLNIVFAWEQAVAITSDQDIGFIASHRFPMFIEQKDKSYLPFLLHFFLTMRGKWLLQLASPGGAGRNKTLGQDEFQKLKITIPKRDEQKKIGDFLSAVVNRSVALREKYDLLSKYKRGIIQQIFARKVRFKNTDGTEFPKWEKKKLGDLLLEHGNKSTGSEPVYSVSVHKGLVDQVEHLGRSFAGKETNNYNRVSPGDIVYTKSPTGSFPLGIIKQSKIDTDVIVSPLYGVFSPRSFSLGYILDSYFQSPVCTKNLLNPVVQKGAKNTINITNKSFLNIELKVPVHPTEQRKIADFLSSIDDKIQIVANQIELNEAFKKGLLQKMFV